MTNEPIINARFKKFKDNYGLNKMQDGDAFERFVNMGVLLQHQPDAFSADTELLEKVCVGGQGDTGIDGIAIKVHGLFVKSIEEINDIIQKYKRITIEFIFIQSKYKPNFSASELTTFIAGVRNFLSNAPSLPANEKIASLLKIKEHLLSDEIIFNWEDSPSIRMYYVAMGKWKNDPHHIALTEQAKADIKSNAFDNVNIHFIDSDSFRAILDSNENNFTEIFETIGTLELTSVEEVTNSCIVLCSANEFAKILTAEGGVIRKSLFDDNVRDYQGENTINTEILETITKEPKKFILLNNGITIVCDDFLSNNRKLKVVNPQIVNGCQTSHVIFYAKQKGIDISKVPINIKIIATKNTEISNEIVKGNNRQNIVQDEAFESTKKFHKDLEAFFNGFINDYQDKIYYERRSKQYLHNPTIKPIQKINLRILTQYFIGMFLNKPHLSHRHESYLLKEYSNIIFQETQSKLPYFAAAYTFYKVEKFFREENFHPELRAYKTHLAMLFREIVGGKLPNINNEKEIDKYSDKLLQVLREDTEIIKHLEVAATIFNSASSIWVNKMKKSKYAMKDVADFTDLLFNQIDPKTTSDKSISFEDDTYTYKGDVRKVMKDKLGNFCGFIRRRPEDIFFHSKQNSTLNFKGLEGKFVTYRVQKDKKNPNVLHAVYVEIAN